MKMKDLTHYFTSPKSAASKSAESSPKIDDGKTTNVNESSKKLKEECESSKADSTTISLNENKEELNKAKDSKDKRKSKKRKPKRRKPSDPAVKNITDLLSSSLSIISPNVSISQDNDNNSSLSPKKIENNKTTKTRKSGRKSGDAIRNQYNTSDESASSKKTGQVEETSSRKSDSCKAKVVKEVEKISPKKTPGKVKITEINEEITPKSRSKSDKQISELVDTPKLENDINETNKENKPSSTSKLNAFQFMMDSRNKSIGQNLSGKENDEKLETAEDKIEQKNKLSARKNLLEKWADAKGRTKRKREEEEIEQHIEIKMKKRARRLKNLLQLNDSKTESDCEIKTGKKTKIKAIVIDPDDSNDTNIQSNEFCHKAGVEKIKSKSNNSSILGFIDVTQSAKKTIIDENKEDKNIKVKKGKQKKNSYKTNPNNTETVIDVDEVSNDSTTIKKKKRKKKSSKGPVEASPESSTVILLDESSQDTNVTPKTNKKAKPNKDLDPDFTPRTLKNWKLKIKLCMDSNADKPLNEQKEETAKPNSETEEVQIIENDDAQAFEDIPDIPHKRELRARKAYKIDSDFEYDDEALSDSEEELVRNETRRGVRGSKRVSKVAPVFLKAVPKPKEDPEVVEARRKFLLSSMPSSLRKELDKQQSIDDIEFDVFPEISHVQQLPHQDNLFSNTCNTTALQLQEISPLKPQNSDLILKNLTKSHIISTRTNSTPSAFTKITKYRKLIEQIKTQNPNYPVYKSFNKILEKSGYKKPPKKVTPKKRGRKKKVKLNRSVEIVETPKQDVDITQFAMWTEKYKPKSSEDIVGNANGVLALKKWLDGWLNFGWDNKRKRVNSTSESEFDMTDCDSRDSTRVPGNMVILSGPCGSGKSSCIYAVCNELGFNVLELNASSKRTGKRLIQELQEATQSHQVRKDESSIPSFFQPNTPKKPKPQEEQQNISKQKMCVLLVEDVDLVFEQDDGFIGALSQLVTTSKRPIILTTTDDASPFAQKFISQYGTISFSPLSSLILSTWLQIVCLVEGVLINNDAISILLEHNKGDVRRTLLQLQFWVQTGGQLDKSCNENELLPTVNKRISIEFKAVDEEVINSETELSEETLTDGVTKVEEHFNCIGSFQTFELEDTNHLLPYPLNLSLLWWNIPNVINCLDATIKRQNMFKKISSSDVPEVPNGVNNNIATSPKNRFEDKERLKSLSRLYDSIALSDVMLTKTESFVDNEPCVLNHMSDLKNSLVLEDSLHERDLNKDLVQEWSHVLVNGCLGEYRKLEERCSGLNMALPDSVERRWRAKHHICEDVLQEALPLLHYTDRKSVATDYMPSLRNITRSESVRALNNTKRGNRFRNYLRGLGIHCGDSTCKIACKILTNS